MKTVQVPILVGVVGLVAAAAFVVAPLTDDNGATSPGIDVGETTAPASTDPTAGGEDDDVIRNDDGTVTRRGSQDAPTTSASLEEKPAPRPAGGGDDGRGTGGDTGGSTGGGTSGSTGPCHRRRACRRPRLLRASE